MHILYVKGEAQCCEFSPLTRLSAFTVQLRARWLLNIPPCRGGGETNPMEGWITER